MLFTPSFPLVVKVGSAEAGFGKIKVDKQSELKDIGGTITRYNEYVTLEPVNHK
jgi:hypothetical protein